MNKKRIVLTEIIIIVILLVICIITTPNILSNTNDYIEIDVPMLKEFNNSEEKEKITRKMSAVLQLVIWRLSLFLFFCLIQYQSEHKQHYKTGNSKYPHRNGGKGIDTNKKSEYLGYKVKCYYTYSTKGGVYRYF